ncbi:PDR/VanB family oxidoreductase [Mycobacterium sp. Aquia_216]|uniref:PDR/VanB family oxidoreductase n=1 Tax=Mycobacterium sp. Aquia_216 TaxID=2991729 RepID=UPI00227B8975|nr:PDR/VanB family oxidoreductase [Mycobacterium sp. Aquia_216]WAJ44304.1 PDR/VanB family oxidoreductase [Mycobacterium sp. Aquia_216]
MELIPGSEQLRVRAMKWEAEYVLSLSLTRDDGSDLPEFAPGAHIDLHLQPDLIRQYSLCSDPKVRNEWKVAVLREPEGRGGSEYVHTVLRPGITLPVSAPRNKFPLVDAESYLFIAGGIGVTPLVPMIKQVAATGKQWRMVYGGRRRKSMAFVDELARLGPQVEIVPQDEAGILDLKTAIEPLSSDTAVYCCGPEGLITAVETTCRDLGRSAPHVERFAKRSDVNGQAEEHGEDRAFQLVLTKSGKQCTVPVGKTIIEVLKEEGIFVPTSCEEGYCGACETRVARGIPDHRDDYLTPEQQASNKVMMVCVGRARSAEIVLDL